MDFRNARLPIAEPGWAALAVKVPVGVPVERANQIIREINRRSYS